MDKKKVAICQCRYLALHAGIIVKPELKKTTDLNQSYFWGTVQFFFNMKTYHLQLNEKPTDKDVLWNTFSWFIYKQMAYSFKTIILRITIPKHFAES